MLFVPGKTDQEQATFMAFVAALSSGLWNHGDIVRGGVATAGNDHRLGAQEAHPAIISLYTGKLMEQQIESIIGGGDLHGYGAKKVPLNTGAKSTQVIDRNLEDRNRTAPFPFCVNRFEFRAVGSTKTSRG